jgi:hypothetical protein
MRNQRPKRTRPQKSLARGHQPEYLPRGQPETPARLAVTSPEYLPRGQLETPTRLALSARAPPLGTLEPASKTSEQIPSLLDAHRHRTESSHPVSARLAVTSQSTSHEGSSKLPPGSRSPARVPPTRAARNSRQARGHQPRVPPTRSAQNSRQASGHQPREAARNSRQARGQ